MSDEIKTQVSALAIEVEALTIRSDDDYTLGGDYLKQVREMRNRVGEAFDPIVEAAHKTHKAALDQKKKIETPLLLCETKLKNAMGAYSMEKQRKMREEEARLQMEAVKAAQAEQAARAAALVQEGKKEEAKQVMSVAPEVPAVVLQKAPPKVEGVSVRMDWDFVIVDPHAVPREYCVPEEQKIRSVVRSLGELARIPGVKVFQRAVTSVRS